MKPAYLKYYERYSSVASMRFALAAMVQHRRLRKLSLMNRQRDYMGLAERPELLPLHLALNRELLAASQQWDSYDYGEGYFYQSLDTIGVSGLRNTRGRIDHMDLLHRVAGRSVLEIGCNAGFLSVAIAESARRVVGFDLNPHLVRMGQATAAHLAVENVELFVSSFEDLDQAEPFDAVLSFANHSTYDKNTRQSIAEYFERCHELLAPGGLLLFESHPPAHEGEGLVQVHAIMKDLFTTREEHVLEYGTFLDTGRTFIVAERPAG